MTPSQQAKAYGCKSVKQVSLAVSVPVRTLYDWSRNKPELYRCVCEWTVMQGEGAGQALRRRTRNNKYILVG